MNTATFSIKDAIGFGWAMVKEKFWFLVALVFISVFFGIMPDVIQRLTDNRHVFFFVQVVSAVMRFVIDAGLIYIMLRLHDGKAVKLSNIFSQYPITFRYFVATVLVYGLFYIALAGVVIVALAIGYVLADPMHSLGIIIGLPLLIILGTYIVVRYQFCRYFIVDKQVDIVKSFKESTRITNGHRRHLFRFVLVLFSINFLGLAAFGIGLFFTLPFSMLATAYVYRKLSEPITEPELIEELKIVLEPLDQSASIDEKIAETV